MIYSVDDIIAPGKPWPPEDKDERGRMTEHAANRQLYAELHEGIFPRYSRYLNDGNNDDKKVKVFFGWPGMATSSYMDLLLGEGITIDPPDLYDAPNEEVFIDSSRYGVGLYEITQDGIGVLNPENVYFVVDPHNIRAVSSYIAFSYLEYYSKTFIKFTIHSTGQIQHAVYELANGKLGDRWDLVKFPQFERLAAFKNGVQQTGVDVPLVVRVDNSLSSERYYGRSDYTPSVHALVEILDQAFARRREVLGKFARPVPMVPESAMRFDHSRQKWVFKTENAIILKEGAQNAAYLTWAAELGSVEREIEQTMTQLLAALKLSRVLIAGENEGQAESGTALRLRLIPTLAKVSKFATALRGTLPIVLSLKSKLNAALGMPGPVYDPEDITITLADGIPEDPAETAQIGLVRAQTLSALKMAGILDTKAAIRAALSMGIITPDVLIPSEDRDIENAVLQTSVDSVEQGGI